MSWRRFKIPNGGPGIENRLQLMYHFGVNKGQLSLNRFVELTSTTPARIFGMYPRKGEIAPGSDADLVIWDPAALYTISAATHHMRVDYSMFEGYEVSGNARTVLSTTRMPFALAEDGYLPPFLTRQHPRYGTPWIAILISAAIYASLADRKSTRLK